MFTSECSRKCGVGTKSNVSLICKEIFHKGIASNQCQRELSKTDEECGKKCEARYGEKWNEFTECSGSCIKRLDELTNMKKKRSRECLSDETLCKKEGGADEILFCDNLKLCPIQVQDPPTGVITGT